jgi:hypothetical protein
MAKTNTKALRISCGAQAMVDFKRLKPFPGNPKDLRPEEAVKLRQEILTVGICKSWTVWNKDGKDKGPLYILDGHQRYQVVKGMIESKIIDGAGLAIPIEEAYPKDAEEAARIVMSLISQHGRLNKAKLNKFVGKAGMDMDKAQQVFSFVELDSAAPDGDDIEDKDEKEPPNTSTWKGAKVVECPACKVLCYQKDHQAKGEFETADIWDEQQG